IARSLKTRRSRSRRVAAAIGLGPTLGVIAAATLTFAQVPTEKARSVLVSSDPLVAAVPAESGPTANAEAQPLQNPAADLANEPAVRFRPNEVQNRVVRVYLPKSIERTLGIHKRAEPTAALATRQQGHTTSCNAASTNTPVSTSPVSLVDAAPSYVPILNNGPVFGLPRTIAGGFWRRTQVIGDPDCKRTELARRGLFSDQYSTSAYQKVTSGGVKTGNSYLQNTQLSINLDTGRAGLWSGGLLHFTVQSRYGSSLNNTFTAGSFAPEYTG